MSVKTITAMLSVADVDRSLAFYVDKLGFTQTGRMAHDDGPAFWANIERDGQHIMLHAGHDHDAEGNDIPLQRAPDGHRDAGLYIYTDDIAALHADLVARGLDVPAPEARFYGMKDTHVFDPDGFAVQFGEPTDEVPSGDCGSE
ncbi:MAG: VOC family protein [Armatimonadetes bacterium]|nr:VOC family protein [Armatimonadota bacterium]